MMNENEAEWEQKLRDEGFAVFYLSKDKAGTFYPDHEHPFCAAHVILKGEMFLTIHGETVALRPGDRFDMEPGETHRAETGSDGCTYLVGQK